MFPLLLRLLFIAECQLHGPHIRQSILTGSQEHKEKVLVPGSVLMLPQKVCHLARCRNHPSPMATCWPSSQKSLQRWRNTTIDVYSFIWCRYFCRGRSYINWQDKASTAPRGRKRKRLTSPQPGDSVVTDESEEDLPFDGSAAKAIQALFSGEGNGDVPIDQRWHLFFKILFVTFDTIMPCVV